MSKFVDKLQSLSKSSSTPIGFHPSVSESKRPAMLLVVGLAGTEEKEARIVADVNADAGLILGDDPRGKVVKQMIEAVGDVPLGVFVKSMSEGKMNELDSEGCDFVVFDIKIPAAVLQKGRIGKFLMIEPSLDQGLVRAINSLEVDGVFMSSKSGDSFVAVEHLLFCRRFVELLEKPVIMSLPPLVTKAELTSVWQAGIDGVVTFSTQSIATLAELKKMIGDLPGGPRGRRAKVGVVIPHQEGLMGGGEDEEEET
jgi:hypothetical protein